MHPHQSTPRRESTLRNHRGSSSCRNLKRSLRSISVLIGLFVCGLSLPVYARDADPLSIWLYNGQGVLVNATSTTTYSDGSVYDTSTGTLIGTVSAYHDPHIYSVTGVEIGIITTDD